MKIRVKERTIELLDLEEIRSILNNLNEKEIISNTYMEAWHYSLNGNMISYINIRTGKIEYMWLQANEYEQEIDSIQSIYLYSVKTPLEIPTSELINSNNEEEKEAIDIIEYLEKKGELEERLENYFYSLAIEETLDWENIEKQIDEIKAHIILK